MSHQHAESRHKHEAQMREVKVDTPTNLHRLGDTSLSYWGPLTDHPGASVLNGGSSQPSLRVRFFGYFELLHGDGEIIRLGRNAKSLAILKYLLSHLTRPVSQDYLMDWLWPDSNPERARWSLNSSIYKLRNLLRGELALVASSDYILFDKGHYRLDPSVAVRTDKGELEACYERGRHLERTQRKPEAAAEYEEAIELYRGDYLLEDLYEDWTMVERERLANAYMDMLTRLTCYYIEIRTCYRLLERDRCYEDGHRLLMECYARLGLPGRALRQYQLCESVLECNWGTTPQPETQDLYRKLLGR
jgi:LuxR family maltose regulon positive regulatory protein